MASDPRTLRSDCFEVRLNGDGSIDEIVAENVSFHLEQMDDGFWWIGLSQQEASKPRLLINLSNKRNAVIRCNAESEDGKISAGFKTP